jgi:ubiquinone/menaquinone biosynthesis C-methylase UbiE
MGTNYLEFLGEAERILKMGGYLMIAEVASRFTSVPKFKEFLKRLGF